MKLQSVPRLLKSLTSLSARIITFSNIQIHGFDNYLRSNLSQKNFQVTSSTLSAHLHHDFLSPWSNQMPVKHLSSRSWSTLPPPPQPLIWHQHKLMSSLLLHATLRHGETPTQETERMPIADLFNPKRSLHLANLSPSWRLVNSTHSERLANSTRSWLLANFNSFLILFNSIRSGLLPTITIYGFLPTQPVRGTLTTQPTHFV